MTLQRKYSIAAIAVALALVTGTMACSPPSPAIKSTVLCRALANDGSPVDIVEAYRPPDIFCLSLEMEGSPRHGDVTTTWFFRNRYLENLREPTVGKETGHLGFRLAPVNLWEIGDYRVEVFIAGDRAQTVHFTVRPPEDAIPSQVTEAVLASRVDDQGRPVDSRSSFVPSDRVRCVVRADLGAYSKIEVQWYAGDRLLEYPHQSHTVSTNIEDSYYDFPLSAREELVPGEYRADVYVDGILGQSLLFRVQETIDQPPVIGLIAFAEGIDDSGQPVRPRTTFAQGAKAVYAAYEFSGLRNGLSYEEVWLLEGLEQTSNSRQWARGEQGWGWAKLASLEGLTPGDYELQLYVDGDLLRQGHFSVEPRDDTGLLYSDDFGDPASGWGEISVEAGNTSYGIGIFRIAVDNAQWVVWSTAGQEFGDVVVEVDAWQASGPGEASYGLLVHYEDADHFYRFDIGGDQQYSVSKSTAEGWVDIVDWTESQAILPNRGINHLEVRCQGQEMRLYVNDELLVTLEDDSFGIGDIGLFGSTFDEGGAVLCFDNVKVWSLGD